VATLTQSVRVTERQELGKIHKEAYGKGATESAQEGGDRRRQEETDRQRRGGHTSDGIYRPERQRRTGGGREAEVDRIYKAK
jgi:hypothetical protein